jgi:hypothetical protein
MGWLCFIYLERKLGAAPSRANFGSCLAVVLSLAGAESWIVVVQLPFHVSMRLSRAAETLPLVSTIHNIDDMSSGTVLVALKVQ